MTPQELTARRKALGLSKVDLGKTLGVTFTTIYRWEDGRHSVPEWVGKFLDLLERVQGCERCGSQIG